MKYIEICTFIYIDKFGKLIWDANGFKFEIGGISKYK